MSDEPDNARTERSRIALPEQPDGAINHCPHCAVALASADVTQCWSCGKTINDAPEPASDSVSPPPRPPEPPNEPADQSPPATPPVPAAELSTESVKLLLRYSHNGGRKFSIEARAQLSPEMQRLVNTYHMGKEIVFIKQPKGGINATREVIIVGLIILTFGLFRLFLRRPYVTVNDLVKGRTLKCAGVVEALETEQELKESCQGLKNLLLLAVAMSSGEKVIDF